MWAVDPDRRPLRAHLNYSGSNAGSPTPDRVDTARKSPRWTWQRRSDQNRSSTDIVTEVMTESEVIQYIVNAFEGVDTVSSSGDTFFFYDPRSELPVDHRFPFATLVTGDHYDTALNLGRLSVFRLNIGVSAETYRSLFGGEEIHRKCCPGTSTQLYWGGRTSRQNAVCEGYGER